MIFIFLFLARGVPGEGPDCHVPKVIVRFRPIPARILKFSIFILALSSARMVGGGCSAHHFLFMRWLNQKVTDSSMAESYLQLRKMACLEKTSVPENTLRLPRVSEISLHRSLLVDP